METKSLLKKLAGLQSSWKKSTPQKGGIVVPDGDYVVRFDSAVLETAKSSGRLQINFTMVILTEEYAGKKIHKYTGMDDAQSLPYLQGDLETLEIEIPENINDIGDALEQVGGLVAQVTQQTRDDFINLYIQELLNPDDYEGEGTATETENEPEPEPAPEDEESEETEGVLTEEDVDAMDKEALEELITDYELDINPKKFPAVAKLRAAVKEQIDFS
jgi:hypothetical protein